MAETNEGVLQADGGLKPCCVESVESAIGETLDAFSEGMADPELKAMVSASATAALAKHVADHGLRVAR